MATELGLPLTFVNKPSSQCHSQSLLDGTEVN